ncbi:MAG: prolipoprotein diacylglyceryl transferase family protein [Candidatus Limivicinus sp.]|jgi:prolipoprotein diacylglyceryltransferase
MSSIAISAGSTTIYWSAIIIAFAVAACFSLSLALYTSYAGPARTIWVMLPFAVLLSVLFSRMIHWYCHAEQYAGFIGAVTDYSGGGYCLPGAFLGTVLAAYIVVAMGFGKKVSRVLDSVAPGAALGIALIRFSALFNNSCRSKIVVESPKLQHLPLAAPVYSGGTVSYHFATFFIQGIILLILFALLLRFFLRRRNRPMKGGLSRDGHVARMFLVWYSAIELVADSTRYDSSFMHFNGFVSIVQMFSAFCILGVLIYYSVMSIRVNGHRASQWGIWIGWFLSLVCVGVSEYMVQRHGDLYLICYTTMSLGALGMALTVRAMYSGCCKKRTFQTEEDG